MSITLVAGTNTRNISLTPTPAPLASLYGAVTDASTSLPIVGVKVTIAGVSTYTDSSGQYGFTNLTPGGYTVTFEKAGYNTLTL